MIQAIDNLKTEATNIKQAHQNELADLNRKHSKEMQDKLQ